MPASDRRALLQDIETPFERGEGPGLWLVKWVVDDSRGTLRFPEGDDECRIAIGLQVAE